MTSKDVLGYISRFTRCGEYPQVIEAFTCGCCYWFAKILHLRFPVSEIVYEPVANHFAAKINGRVYDITGDVTDQGQWELWSEYELGSSFREGIVKECIMFCR